MTCVQCSEKTLYDKTVARRVSTASRRAKRITASTVVLGLLALGGANAVSPVQAAPDFSGFSTSAQATPLRIEIYEPTIPIPASPQLELNFSYTKVDGASGPIGTARASAMWPGAPVGEGLKTFGEQLGFPSPLTDGGYPIQINAQSPGDVGAATQEFFPGMTGKVSTTDKTSISKVGYGTSGDVKGAGDSGSAPSLLDLLQSGDLTALGGMLSGTQTAPQGGTPGSSPLGPLALLVNAGGMQSISSTTYDPADDSVVATSTSRLGEVALLGGIVTLNGVEVVTKVTSNIAEGAKVTRKVTIGSMAIAGQKFAFTGDGIEAMGKNTPIPGLPDDPAKALAALGITIDMGKAVTTKSGASGSVTAEGLRITIDTKPLISKLPKLPLGDLINQLPDLPGQASILKGLLLGLAEATPKVAVVLGQSTAMAETVAGLGEPPVTTTDPPITATGPIDGGPITSPLPNEIAPAGLPGGPDSTAFNPISAPGLPGLGSIPLWLLLGGLALALGVGWYIRSAGLVLFGGAGNCAHGLKAGIPDLRKA